MDDRLLNAVIAATLSTVNHFGIAGETVLYVALLEHGIDLVKWNIIKSVLIKEGYITDKYHVISITKKGQEAAKQIDDALAKAEKELGK